MSSPPSTDEDAPPPEPVHGIALRADHPDGVFDADWYTKRYPDAADGDLAPWEHFLAFGDAEHRAPGPDFDPAFYARTYQPLEGEHPAYHYIVHGRPRGYLTQAESFTRRESTQAMRAALLRRRHPILLVGNDAQEAGAPILLLEVARHLAMRGFGAVFVLRRGGPLLDVFRSLGPTFIADEGWDMSGLGAAVRETIPVLASTGWGARLLDELGLTAGGAVMVHEMTAYLQEQGLVDSIGRTRTVIMSMPAQRDALQALLPTHSGLDLIRPGLSTRAPRRRARKDVGRFLASQWGTDAVVFIGAGYADRRKGFDLFLEAARGIHSREPHARFIWLGHVSSWGRRLADHAMDDGLPLLLPGFRRDSKAWYAQAKVYLLTSRQDPGPTTVMDAARAGVPFVAYDADIGLRSIDDQLEGVGEFVRDRSTFIRRALELAANDPPSARRDRSSHIARLTPFGAYVDQLVAALRSARRIEEPPHPVQWTGGRTMWMRPLARRALQRWHSAFTSMTRAIGLPDPPPVHQRPVVGPWMHHAPPVRWGTNPIVLAVAQSGAVPPDALTEAREVGALQPGATAWLADPALLQQVPHPAVVHVARDQPGPPWQIVSAVESATPTLVALHQYGDRVPRWFTDGAPPPTARWPRAGRPPRAHAVALAASGETPKGRPIGVFLHAFYVDVAERLARPLQRLPADAQLYISTDTRPKPPGWPRSSPTRTCG